MRSAAKLVSIVINAVWCVRGCGWMARWMWIVSAANTHVITAIINIMFRCQKFLFRFKRATRLRLEVTADSNGLEKSENTHMPRMKMCKFFSVVSIKIQWMDNVDWMFIMSRMSVFHIIQFSPHCVAAIYASQSQQWKNNRKWKKNRGLAFFLSIPKVNSCVNQITRLFNTFKLLMGVRRQHFARSFCVRSLFSHSSCLRLRFHNCFRCLTHKMCSKIIANTLNYTVSHIVGNKLLNFWTFTIWTGRAPMGTMNGRKL